MADITTLSVIVSILSLLTTIVIARKKDAVQQVDQHIALRLGQFKDELVEDLQDCFVDKKILDLQLELRDSHTDALRRQVDGIDHRTTRNTEHIAMLLKRWQDSEVEDNRERREQRQREERQGR